MSYSPIIKFDHKPRLQWEQPKHARAGIWRWLAVPLMAIAIAWLAQAAVERLPKFELKTKTDAQVETPAFRAAAISVPLKLPGLRPDSLPYEPLITTPQHLQTNVERAPIGEAKTTTRTVGDWQDYTITVRTGDNLSTIFDRYGLGHEDLHRILSLGKATACLKRLHPEQTIRFKLYKGQLQELVYELDKLENLRVKKTDDGFLAKREVLEPEITVATRGGIVKNSLFFDGQAAGLSAQVIMQLVEIFGWDIDFALDIRKGDAFAVVYEELLIDGIKVGDGDILAAEFINQGDRRRAVRYVDENGRAEYYSDNGQSMRKAFLRTPVNFTRISSHFNLNRRHPVLNRIRAHRGVDYAAPTGTPVKATGDGKVIFAGRKGGYGNTVILQHGGKYSTLYAHLSRFAKGINQGKMVTQGEIIGHVGQTGLATGPHLHYEFRVDGVHQNPLTVQLPKTVPLPAKRLADFKQQTRSHVASLDQLSHSLANNATSMVATAPIE